MKFLTCMLLTFSLSAIAQSSHSHSKSNAQETSSGLSKSIGWEPQVNLVDGKLIYSIPVSSSFVTMSFDYEIQSQDLGVLNSNDYRLSILNNAAHTLIQNTFGPSLVGQKKNQFSQTDFDHLINNVLHSSEDQLQSFIDSFDREHNISLRK